MDEKSIIIARKSTIDKNANKIKDSVTDRYDFFLHPNLINTRYIWEQRVDQFLRPVCDQRESGSLCIRCNIDTQRESTHILLTYNKRVKFRGYRFIYKGNYHTKNVHFRIDDSFYIKKCLSNFLAVMLYPPNILFVS